MSTVKKAQDALFASTSAAARAHEAKLARHREHLAKLRKERAEREAAQVAAQIEAEGA